MSKQSFEKSLRRYAELLITRGVGLLKGQLLIITGESVHESFAKILAEVAYAHGAKYVEWALINPWLRKLHLASVGVTDYGYVPPHAAMLLNQLVDCGGAVLSLRGPEQPELFENFDPNKVQAMNQGRRKALNPFYSKGIDGGVHWCIGCVATPGWAERVFPKLKGKKAESRLWKAIFQITGADREDCLEQWDELDRTLHARTAKLDALSIKTLIFEGNGTKLQVGLSCKAKWLGGSLASGLKKGRRTSPNVPSVEVFTTPDLRRTEGVLKATKPVWINGTLVEGLVVHFKKGKVVKFSARKGRKAFAAMLAVDKGAKFLGEIAIVGIDSPIYKSGLLFEETLYDENCACHAAFGNAYLRAIAGRLSKNALAKLGVNSSAVHHDVMLSDKNTDVTAITYSGKQVALIRKGRWVI